MAHSSMHTIVLATQKGGSGKSTLAIGLALAAKQAGHNVRLIETDPQGTLSNWRKRRVDVEPIVETICGVQEIESRLETLADCGVTVTIVDTASGVSTARTAAIRHADLCLVPARPCIADIEATASVMSLVRTWKKPFAFVLNQAPIRGRRVSNATDALVEDVSKDLVDVIARPFIVMRNDHQDALSAGLGVSEYATAGKSAEEMCALWRWVEDRLTADSLAGEQPPDELVACSPEILASTPAEPATFVS